MTEQVVTQLIIDASGAKGGAADFEAAMAKAKAAAVDGGNATAASFEKAQQRWTQSLAATDPVIKAQIAMERDLAKQRAVGADAVRLGISTQDAANAQLDRVRQKHEALIQTVKTGESAQTAFGKATSGVSGQLIALSAGAGPVGVFLASLGPWGLAASVALGVLGTAINYVSEEAERMGHKAIDVQQFSAVTGLAVDQISSLKRLGASAGVDGDTVASSFGRLTAGLTDARRASGQLYEDVQRVSGSLAAQLKDSTSTAGGIDVLAKAYHEAGDEALKASIARAAFGKGGAGLGPVLDTIATAGGIDALSNKTKELNDATAAQTKRWAEMQAQIDIANKSAKNILASIFTEDGLTKALAAAQYLERIARASKDAAQQREGLSFLQGLAATAARTSDAAQGDGGAEILEAVTAKFAALQRITKGMGSNIAVDQKTIESWAQLGDAFRGVQTPAEQAAKSIKGAQDAAAASAKTEGERIGIIGSAASIEERRIARELQLKSSLLDNKVGQEDFNRAVAANNLEAYTASLNGTISALGAAASTTLQVAARMATLQKLRQDGANISDADIANQRRISIEQANGTASILQQVDAQRIQTATIGLSVGAAAGLSAKLQLLAADARAGKVATDEDTAARKAATDALTAQAQAAAQASAQSKANFDLATSGLGGVDKQIADIQFQLHGDGWQQFMNDGLAATMRLADQVKSLKSATDSFGQSLLSGLLAGQGPLKALTSAAQQYISTLASDTLKRVQNGGSLFGNQDLGSASGGLAVASAGLAGYKSGSPLSGALGGALAGATFGPVGAVVGGAVGLVGGLFGADAQKKAAEEAHQKEVQAAKDAWARMEGQWKEWLGSANGHNIGSLQSASQNAYQQASDFIHKIAEAHDLHAGDPLPPEIKQTIDALYAFQNRAIAEFGQSWGQRLSDMTNGIGPDSPFAQAINGIKAVAADVEGFVSDTAFVMDDAAAAKAARAGSDYLLSLLRTVPALTDTQQELQTLNGKALALQQALVDLGNTADAAAAAISSTLAAAMDDLRDKFSDGLKRAINETTGKDYLNQIADAITQHKKNVADAESLGLSSDLSDQLFNVQIQKIVDGADLVGTAFSDLTKKFPELAGVVKTTTNSIQAMIDGLKIGDKSTLSPQEKLAAAQATYDKDLAKVQGGDSSAVGALATDTDALLSLAKDLYASSKDYATIFDNVMANLQALTGKVNFASGGIVGSYAAGGLVGNGMWNVDSVLARYASGGHIALAGGEGIINAAATRKVGPSVIDLINRTGQLPSNDNSPDYTAHFVNLARVTAQGFNNQTEALIKKLDELQAEVKRMADERRIERPARPGRAA